MWRCLVTALLVCTHFPDSTRADQHNPPSPPNISPVFLETELQTAGFGDYFNQLVRESSGGVRRSIVQVKRLNSSMGDHITELTLAAEQFSRTNADKLPFAGDILGRVKRFATQVGDMTQLFCQRGEHYAKQSLSFVSEVLPLCKQSCPGLFPSTVPIFSPLNPDPLSTDPSAVTLLEFAQNPPSSTNPRVPDSSAQPAPPNSPDQALEAQDSGDESPHHHHKHHRSSSSSAAGAMQPGGEGGNGAGYGDDPAITQLQAAEDLWNGGSDFNSATTLFKEGIQDLTGDFKRALETFLQQTRFSPMSGDAFRKGGLDGVRATAEWTERNAEISRAMRETVEDVVADQLQLTERLGHLAFESLEVCRACNIPLQSTVHRPIDVELLRAKALTRP